MRILLLNQFFWPDSSATSQLLTDLARELAHEGHEVHAICAASAYAPSSVDDAPAVQVHRVQSSKFARGRVARVLSYASFYLGAAWCAFRMVKPDIVLSLTTPPLLSVLGSAIKRLRGSRHFIWEMDLYPEVAVDLGQFKAGGSLERITGLLADHSRRHADGVIALGECMKARLVHRGIPARHIAVADNWADSRAITPAAWQSEPGKFHVLYSGNLGAAHDLDTTLDAARNLREDTRFCFDFAGGGGGREKLARIAEEEQLTSIQLLPYADRADLGQSLGRGDVGLVTQRDACSGSVVPSKVYGLLAAGRPVLFVGPASATPALIIQRFRCGWHVPCGDVETLTTLLLFLADHPEIVRSTGQRAREALLEHFDLPLGAARIAQIIGARPLHAPLSRHSAEMEGREKCLQARL